SLCEMPETLLEYAGQRNTTSDGTPCVHWQDLDTNHTVASYRKEDFPGKYLPQTLKIRYAIRLSAIAFVLCSRTARQP
ncbi:hypothetical protein BaRGS_00033074, partial [Batillaria attramentaria]